MAGAYDRSMKLEAVVFDLDGLMLDSEPLYKDAWQWTATDLGYDLDDRSYSKLIGLPEAASEAALVAQFCAAFPLDAFRERWPPIWRARAEAGIAVKPGLLDLLALLTTRGVPIAVATSSEAEYADFSLQAAGLADRFRAEVTCDQVARGKPAPDLYLEAARRLGVAPARCLALEDSETGITAARAAGMTALLIPDLTPATEAATRAALRVLPSLTEACTLIEALLGD